MDDYNTEPTESKSPYYIMAACGMFLLALLGIGVLQVVKSRVVGTDLGSITGTTVSGESISSDNYPGKVIVLDFWATWCPPCVAKVPEMMATQSQFSDSVQVIGISGDRDSSALERFQSSKGMNYPSILGGADQLYKRYRVSTIPHIMIIDSAGKIRYSGYPQDVDKLIANVLN